MQNTITPPRNTTPVLLLAALLITFGTLAHTAFGFIDPAARSQHAWGSDDAYISYRYSLHLTTGEGLVFNPGGERVEGYSTFLYVLLMAAGIAIVGKANIFLFSTAINIVLLVIALFIFWNHARRSLSPNRAQLATLLFALCPVVWLWGSSGMEVAAVLIVQIGAVAAIPLVMEGRRGSRLGLAACIVVSVLLRADGFLLPLLCIVYLFFCGKRRDAILFAGVLAATVIPYFVWRYSYYQDWLPNTYYAKVAGDIFTRAALGMYGLIRTALSDGMWMYVLFLVVVGLATALRLVRRSRRRGVWPVPFELWFALGWIAYFIYIGGDLYADRFLVPLFPVGIIFVLRVLPATLERRKRLALVGVALLVVQLSPYVLDARFAYNPRKSYDSLIALGQFLARYHPSARIALSEAGKATYFPDLVTIDMLGLNDRTIARSEARSARVGTSKYDENYVISQKPDLIITWVYPSFDMDYGLTRAFYSANGYRLRYIVYAREIPFDVPVYDVAGADEPTIANAINSGYIIGILERIP
jgi:arabinofuranosyltransferase